jgi:hypothetical protein
MSARIAPEGATPRRPRRRTLLASLLVALVLAGAGGWLVLRPGSDAGPTAAAAMETPLPPAGSYGESVLDPSTTAEPTDVPEVVLADVPGLPEALPPVALGGSPPTATASRRGWWMSRRSPRRRASLARRPVPPSR